MASAVPCHTELPHSPTKQYHTLVVAKLRHAGTNTTQLPHSFSITIFMKHLANPQIHVQGCRKCHVPLKVGMQRRPQLNRGKALRP
eukprot:1147858-Pelagomonas_calceolata.AAC.4